MIFSKSRPVKIVLVGTGGTGGYIVPQLYRLLYALDRPIRVILCDGDLVEEKNLGRQNFIEADLGKNKAMVLAERYSNAFGIETSYIPQYVEDEEMLEELLEPLQYPQNRYVTNQNGEAVRTAFGTSPDTAASWCPTAQWMGISRAFRSVWTMRKTRSGSTAGSPAGAAPTESDAPRGFMLPGILAPRPPT